MKKCASLRLAALQECRILDTPPDEAFDEVTRLAAEICEAPIATLTLLDEKRQWFKSVVGLDNRAAPREIAFCSHAVLGTGLMVVPDANQDERFANNPLVTGHPHIRFYAGVPLVTPDGFALGTLCVIDRVPRQLTGQQKTALVTLAHQVTARLELQRRLHLQEARLASRDQTVPSLSMNAAHFQNALAHAAVGLGIADLSGRVISANHAYAGITGYTEAELLSQNLLSITHPEDRKATKAHIERLLAGEVSTFVQEKRYVRKDGTIVWVQNSVSLGRDADGKPSHLIALTEDITERKKAEQERRQAEEALRASEAKYRKLAESGVIGVVTWGFDGRFTTVNDKFLEMTGYSRAEFEAGRMRWDDMTPPEWKASCEEAVLRLRRTGIMVPYEKEFFRQDGSRLPILMGGTLLEKGGGGISFVLDLTAQKQAEEALRERTEVLESVLATIPHQVFWKDRNSVYLGCNSRFAHAAGLDAPAQVVGKTDADLPWTSEEAETYRREDRRVLTGETAVLDLEETYQHDSGVTTVGLTCKLPLHDADGAIIGVLGVSQDITARKALEAERERLLHETERLLVEARDRADRDPLTDLLNHRAFHSLFEKESARAEREGVSLAVVVLDLDNFKFFNDSYGHAVGDDVLRMVARRLQTACRSYDTVGRFGGDEFALLLPGAGQATATQIEARLRANLAGLTFRPEGQGAAIPIIVSVGAALFTPGIQDRLDVLREADERLLRAKTGGTTETEAEQVRASALRRVQGFSMLDALVTAVDNKDRYTRRHSEDVMAYSLMIARALGLDEKTQQDVAVSALLHDVGKIGVPDAILRKPGRLTAAEFEAVQQHPQMGAIMVSAVAGLEVTLDAVRHHHERWDGGGYPFGLRGEECPLIARLMAVADAFSAMTTDRPYRRGMEREKALAILVAGAGTQWDPRCVEAFTQAFGVS